MEKNSYKVVAVVSLVVAVLALAIGFAAYTASLTIENATATATASNTFTPQLQYKQGTLNCVKTSGGAAVTSAGQLDDASHAIAWQNIAVTLDGPGDSITCTATVENLSTFTAYLKSITFASDLSCNPAVSGTTVQNLQAACDTITVTASEGTGSANATGNNHTNASSVSGVSIGPVSGTHEDTITLVIEYPGTNPVVTDADFVVTIPTITFGYSTAQ